MVIPWTLLGLGVVGVVTGAVRFIRDRRRLSNAVLVLLGLVLVLPSLMILTANPDGSARTWHYVVIVTLIGFFLVGYPLLALFLMANGFTMLRKERRSLANMLSLFAGLGMAALPFVFWGLNRIDDSSTAGSAVVVGVIVGLWGICACGGFCFFVFLVAAVAYRRVPRRFQAGHVIVLGSGLRGDRVPPLLASRLRKGQLVADAQNPPAVIIPSGARGPGETVAEGDAMARWLRGHGVSADRILVEDQARTTLENLRLSRALLPSLDTPSIVVTTSYHVFRAALLTRQLQMPAVVVGAPTASYYVPSAFLREWIAVMRENLWLHVVLVGCGVLAVGAGVVVSLMPF